MSKIVSRDVTETARANERVLTESPVARRLSMLAAAVAVPAVAGTNAQAADFFNSGPIASNNTVGWSSSNVAISSFPLTLTSGTANLFTFFNGTFFNHGSFWIKLGTNAQNKNFLAAATNYVITFPAAKRWTTASIGGPANNKNLLSAFMTSSIGNVFGKVNVTDKYLLFKFTDTAQDYYGWVLVSTTGNWNGNSLNLRATVKSYAWQKATYGVIQSGAVAVPEPSTIVTSGIAALTGGAIALRRWRRERKQAEAMA